MPNDEEINVNDSLNLNNNEEINNNFVCNRSLVLTIIIQHCLFYTIVLLFIISVAYFIYKITLL